MSGVFPKYIVEDGRLVMMNTTFHAQIVNNQSKVAGGGFFRFGSGSRSIVFYGESQEYGKASLQSVKDCVLNEQVYMYPPHNRCIANKYRFYYDTGTAIIELKKKIIPSNISVVAFIYRLAERGFYNRKHLRTAHKL